MRNRNKILKKTIERKVSIDRDFSSVFIEKKKNLFVSRINRSIFAFEFLIDLIKQSNRTEILVLRQFKSLDAVIRFELENYDFSRKTFIIFSRLKALRSDLISKIKKPFLIDSKKRYLIFSDSDQVFVNFIVFDEKFLDEFFDQRLIEKIVFYS